MAGSKLEKQGSLAKSLFLGNILEQNLLPFPSLSADEGETVRMVLDSVDRFMQERRADFNEYDRSGNQPDDYLQALAELGLFGLIIPEEGGGLGLSNMAYSRVLQQTSRYDASTSLTIGAHSSIGMKGLLLFGSPQQKEKYYSKLATGESIAAFCLTEPGAGSDASAIKTRADKQDDGSWLLNGDKIWITNGPIADFFTVFAKTASESGKMSAFIVERSWTGVSTGAKEDKMGIRASATSTVAFENVRVPAENLLGQEGHGFKIAMSILNSGRTGLGGGCVGGMKEAIRLCTEQALTRKQFGRSVAEFELVQEKIGQMAVSCFAAESVVTMVAHYIDSDVEDFSVEAAISKVFATECMWNSINEALQIAGGNGFMREYPYERVVRDSRINMIFEGTNEILRLYIGLSGMKDAGEQLSAVRKGLTGIFNDPIKGFGVLSALVSKKVSALTSLGRERMEHVPAELREHAEVYELYTARLSQAVEAVLIRYGKKIVEKQFATKRIADVAIDLVVGLCTLSRVCRMVSERGVNACQTEIKMLNTFTQQAKHRMNGNVRQLISNQDDDLTAVAKAMLEGGYNWDIL
jgi:acyl-CoA dehydrogenase family member 9